ncbi:MAG TPA: VWA domain-containing protein [Elusimicrobiales bacterium]|nr:VWA domain-containing protein [Elusimicrobiales bacterium]
MELFKYPAYLAWLTAGFIALLFFRFKAGAAAARAAAAVMDAGRLADLTGEKALARKRTRELLYLAGLAFLVAAAGGPQWGMDMAPVMDMNGSLAVAVDTSLSMGARDLKPSRMENAKLMLNALADRFKDYRMGVIAFSGNAYVQCPLTTDTDAVKYFLSYLAPGILPEPGTNIASAIAEAETMLGRYSGQKVLVLITDGENTDGSIEEALGSAAASGLKIFTVGIGKPEGELIPEGGGEAGYKKDLSGKTVVTRLDESALLKIAQTTGAEYIRYGGDPEAAAGEIRATVARLSLSRTKGFGRSVYRNRYRIPLSLAFLLLLIEFMFMEKGSALQDLMARLLKRPGKSAVVLALSLTALSSAVPAGARAASPESAARKGNGAYRNKDFPKAYEQYSRALEAAPKNARIRFNRGAAAYRMEDYGRSAEDSESAAADPKVKAASAYNAGNAFFRLSDFSKAAAKYRESLLASPGDPDAAYNLQKALIALKKSKENKQDQKEQKKQEKKEQDKEQKKKQEQNGGGGQDENKKKDEQKKKEAARNQADKLLELMKEKEKESGNREMMNARFNGKPRTKKGFSGKDW